MRTKSLAVAALFMALVMAQTAARVIQNSGLLRDGFSFQTGAGGATLATAMYLKQIMLREQIHGRFSYSSARLWGHHTASTAPSARSSRAK